MLYKQLLKYRNFRLISNISFNFWFFNIIYTARYLGVTEFGVYSFAMSFTTLFMVLADIGVSQLIIREIARNKKI